MKTDFSPNNIQNTKIVPQKKKRYITAGETTVYLLF